VYGNLFLVLVRTPISDFNIWDGQEALAKVGKQYIHIQTLPMLKALLMSLVFPIQPHRSKDQTFIGEEF